MNECFNVALNRERISWDSIHKAEAVYSLKRLRSLKEEWGGIYPSFEETIEILRNLPDKFSGTSMSKNTIDAVLRAITANKFLEGESREQDVINEIMLCLYTVGIVGFKISSLTPYKWAFRDSTPTTKNEIKRASLMKIHKMLHSALDIRIITGNRYERDDEEDIECS